MSVKFYLLIFISKKFHGWDWWVVHVSPSLLRKSGVHFNRFENCWSRVCSPLVFHIIHENRSILSMVVQMIKCNRLRFTIGISKRQYRRIVHHHINWQIELMKQKYSTWKSVDHYKIYKSINELPKMYSLNISSSELRDDFWQCNFSLAMNDLTIASFERKLTKGK